MAISKITLNGVTQMDVTGKTVTAASMLSPVTALKNDGTDVTGSIPTKTSANMTASGATVTASAGYYASDASKSVDTMTLPTAATSSATSGFTSKATISRSTSDQYINIPTGYNSAGAYYKVSAVANGTAGTPTATKGTVSNNSISVTPSVTNTTGYITGGTKTGTAVTVSASELVSGTKSITESGTTDVTNYASASVAAGSVTAPSTISGTGANINVGQNTLSLGKTISVTPTVTTAGYITSGTAKNVTVSLSASVNTRSSSDLSASGATVTAPAGYYSAAASASVASGTAGTPTATKGTINNHAVTVTPSVTNTTGYITGGTKTGTGVSVAASELVSGSQTFSRNGTFDVTNLAQIITNFSSLSEFEFGTFTPATDVATYNITFANTHLGLPCFAIVANSEESYDSTTYTNAWMVYYNFQEIFRAGFKVASSSNNYGAVHAAYRTTGTSTVVFSQYPIYYSNSNTGSSGNAYPRYWVTESGMRAEATSTSYWRSTRTYYWAAFWNPYIDPSWESGAINTDTGVAYNSSTRIRTGIYLPANVSIRVYPKSGTKVSVLGWNSSYTFVPSSTASSWTSTEFNLINKIGLSSGMSYVKLMAAYTDDREITDVGALAGNIIIRGMT